MVRVVNKTLLLCKKVTNMTTNIIWNAYIHTYTYIHIYIHIHIYTNFLSGNIERKPSQNSWQLTLFYSLSCNKLSTNTLTTFLSLQPSSPLSCSLQSYKKVRIRMTGRAILYYSIHSHISHIHPILTTVKASLKFFRVKPSPVPLKVHFYIVKNYFLRLEQKIIWLHNYQHDKSIICNFH